MNDPYRLAQHMTPSNWEDQQLMRQVIAVSTPPIGRATLRLLQRNKTRRLSKSARQHWIKYVKLHESR